MIYRITKDKVYQHLAGFYQRAVMEIGAIRDGIEPVVLKNAGLEYAMASPSDGVVYMAERQQPHANGKGKKLMPRLEPPRPPKIKNHKGRWIGK